ncbi:MAG: GNAT family N-acetyltransferase [Phycisphaerae bacterium]
MDRCALEFRIDDLREPPRRDSMLALLASVFGNDDVTIFADSGRWDASFRSIGYWHDDRCVANVGVFDMPLIVDGHEVRSCGVQAVATDPAFRRRGLFKSLMREAVRHIDSRCELSLLFTANPALYERFGYRIVCDDVFLYRRRLPPSVAPCVARPLSINSRVDIALLEARRRTAAPISRQFAPSPRGAMFWYNELRHGLRRVYDLPTLDALAVFDHDGGRLRLLDMLADRLPSLDDLIDATGSQASVVELWFSPDQFDAVCEVVPRRDGDFLMARGPLAIEGRPFAFPPPAYF